MPEAPKKSNLQAVKRWQRDAAKDYYLRHPDASINDVCKATDVPLRTVARARADLVAKGLLAPGRNASDSAAEAAALAVASRVAPAEPDAVPTSEEPAPTSEEPANLSVTEGRPGKKPATLDDEALRSIDKMLDELSSEEDNEVVRKKMLKQVQRFAFDPRLHPDTRMSASQLWAKLIDLARGKSLGPGKPLTLVEAISRATDFCKAAGAKVMVPAFYAAFDLPVEPASSTPAVEPTPLVEPVCAAGEDRPAPPPAPLPSTPDPPPAPPVDPNTSASPW